MLTQFTTNTWKICSLNPFEGFKGYLTVWLANHKCFILGLVSKAKQSRLQAVASSPAYNRCMLPIRVFSNDEQQQIQLIVLPSHDYLNDRNLPSPSCRPYRCFFLHLGGIRVRVMTTTTTTTQVCMIISPPDDLSHYTWIFFFGFDFWFG